MSSKPLLPVLAALTCLAVIPQHAHALGPKAAATAPAANAGGAAPTAATSPTPAATAASPTSLTGVN